MSFSPACPAGIDCPGGNGQSILTGSRDKTAILWNLQGDPIQTFKGHTSSVNAVSFSPDGQSILTGSRDKTAILWNLQGDAIHTFKGHTSSVYAVSFSPACPAGIDCPGGNGQSILTGSRDKTAILWNLQGDPIHTFKGHTSDVNAVSFSPDGQSILTGSRDNTAILWNLQGDPIHTFKGHTSDVNAVSFSPDGHFALSASSPNDNSGRSGIILKALTPWAFFQENVAAFSLGALRALGLQYTQEDVEAMKKRRKGKLW